MSNTATDDEEIKPPKVTGSPERIWLVYGDIERDCTHAECEGADSVSWCEDKQFDSDVEYVRADALTAKAATIAEQAAQLEALRAVIREARQALEAANVADNGPIRDTIWMPGRPETLFDFLDAALAGKAVTP